MATFNPNRRSLVDQIPTEDRQGPAVTIPANSGIHGTELGRQAFNTAMALPGIGGVTKAASTGGLISRAFNGAVGGANKVAALGAGTTAATAFADDASGSPSPQPSTAGAGRGSINPIAADPVASLPTAPGNSIAEAPRQQDWNRQGMSNAQVGQANPQGRVQAQRQPNGLMSFSGGNVSGPVSYTNDSGAAVPGAGIEGKGFGGFDSAPAGASVGIGAGGYAFETSAAQQVSPVGMSVQEAQSKGLVGERVGYNPAYDQRINGVTQPAQSNSLTAVAQGQTQPHEGKPKESLTDFANRMAAMEKGGAGQRINAPTVAHSGNDFAARKRLENMATSASSITNSSRWGGHRANQNPSVMAFMLAQQADLAAQGKQPDMEMQVTGLNAGLEREGMQQAGADRRDMRRGLVDMARLQGEQETQGFANRAAGQQEQLRNTLLDPNATPEQRAVAQRSLAALSGKTAADRMQTVNLPDTTTDMGAVVRGGQALIRTLEDGSVQQVPIGAQQQIPANHIAALRSDPKLAAQFDAQYGAGASQRHLAAR